MNTKMLFGGLIAIILLGLYAFCICDGIRLAITSSRDLPLGVSSTLDTVSGLVSALVIAELAITQPGSLPGTRGLVGPGPGDSVADVATTRNAGYIGVIYVLVWITVGLAAFVVGVMLDTGKVKSLTDYGQEWLGLAVAAGYSYFGIRR